MVVSSLISAATSSLALTLPELMAMTVDEALAVLRRCESVYCTRSGFGSVTEENRRLLQCAEELGLLRPLPD